MQDSKNRHDDQEADDVVFIDQASIEAVPPLPSAPGVMERLSLLENERRAAYSQMHRMVADIGTLKSGRDRWIREREMLQSDAMYRLALLAEYRSGGNSAKVLRIGVMSALIASALDCDEDYCDRLQAAAPLHDVGEIGLPDSLFGALEFSEMERALMRSHCRLGNALLAESLSPEIRMAAEIALTHHERFDGSGYPEHLAGKDIPLASRIVGVVDSFDALTSNRPYRRASTPAAAVDLIKVGSGTLFDPAVIEAFRQVSEALLIVRWVLDEKNMRPEGMKWLGKPPEPGFWKRFM